MTYKENRAPELRDLLPLLRARWKMIAACAVTGALLAVLVAAILPPRYTAKAQLLVARSDAGPSDGFDESVVDTHVELILSPSHLREVLKSLADDPPGPTTSAPPYLRALAKDAWRRLREASAGIFPFDDAPDEIQPLDFERLQKNLNVYKEQRSRVVAVTFTADDPQMAAIIANRMAETYVNRGRDRLLAERQRQRKDLAELIPAARAALEHAEAAVRDHRTAVGLLDEKSFETMDRQIAELRRQLAIDLAKLGGEENERFAPLRSRQDHERDREQLFKILGTDRSASSFRLGTEPETSQDDAGHRDNLLARGHLRRVVNEAFANLPPDRSALQERRQRTIQRLESLTQSRKSLRDAETKLRDLEREAAESAQLYDNLIRRQTELFAQNQVQQEAHIISAALPPELPSSPSPILFILPAFVAFAMGGGLTAVMMEQLNRRVRGERDVEESVGVQCIGLVPRRRRFHARSPQRDLVDDPFNIYGEAVRSVVATAFSRRRVPARQRRFRNCAAFAVTSSERGEGKSTLALSFAVSAGALGYRVLLIDLNFRNPEITNALGSLAEEPAAPAGNAGAPEPTVKRLAELGIDCLLLGDKREHALSLLSKSQPSSILDPFRAHYDCIVIDSPPLLGATEARAIASIADNVIFTLKWGATDIDVAGRALRQLEHAGINIERRVFGVITQVNARKHRFYQ